MGGSSACGVISQNGLSSVGIVALFGLAYRVGLGIAGFADEAGSARMAAAEAARMATREMSEADLLFTFLPPGCEELVLSGICDVCSSQMPIWGGSTADNVLRSDQVGRCWQLHGSSNTGWAATPDNVAVAALCLNADANVHWFMAKCYAPKEFTGTITRASGRVIDEIDNCTAEDVFDDWMLGVELDSDREKLSFARRTARFPLAVEEDGASLRLLHVRSVTPSKGLECFSNVVCEGSAKGRKVHLLDCKTSDVFGTVTGSLRKAMCLADFEVQGCLLELCVGFAANLQDFDTLAQVLSEICPNVFCFFSRGQQGMIRRRARHCNLMINISLFG